MARARDDDDDGERERVVGGVGGTRARGASDERGTQRARTRSTRECDEDTHDDVVLVDRRARRRATR